MGDPKGFMKFQRQNPEQLPVEERTRSWKEFAIPLAEPELRNQGARCMDCGVAFCQGTTGCPVQNFIPDWNDLVHRGRWFEASKLLHQTNNFPELTGKLCPAPCESACVLGVIDSPVSIRNIESAIVERGFAEGWVTPQVAERKSGKHVGILGSGPAGLAAAQQLARAGHTVTVYEKSDRIGGLLRYGIPDFKLEKRTLNRRLEQLRAEGVEFRTGVNVGADIDAREWASKHDAVCLAIGAEQPRELSVPGRELAGVHLAMEYLSQQNRMNAGDSITSPITALGKDVVVIGGGDTGSDCVGTARRQGCMSVYQFELLPMPPSKRDSSTPWPQWPLQLRTSHAHEEGCDRRWSYQTTEFVGKDGHVAAVRGHRVRLEGGKFVAVPNSDFELKAELVLLAMGFTGLVRAGVIEKLGVACDARGNIVTDADYRTNVPAVFAAGDSRRGASLIVWAIAEGRRMAEAVDRALGP